MGKGKNIVYISAAVSAGVIVLVLAGVFLYRFLAPNSAKAVPDFGLEEEEIALLVDGGRLEENGAVIDGQKYVPAAVASQYFDQRIYVDESEKLLFYAAPEGLTEAEADKTAYTFGKETKEVDTPFLRMKGKEFYVSVSFLEEHAPVEIEEYENPPRLVVHGDRTKTYTFATADEALRLRKGPGKKYAWLAEIDGSAQVIVEPDIKKENEYMAVTTLDGITGYVPEDKVKVQGEKEWEIGKTPKSFEQKPLGKTVCLGWHQVTTGETARTLYSGIEQTKMMNVISPTVFALSDNKGNFSSIASADYVNQAHKKGLQVWGLLNDFSTDIDLHKILTSSDTRKKLVNGLVGSAVQYGLDGINIDFEKVKQKTAPAYLEFLRELVLKAHINDIIISVDNYTPASYNAYYDLAEQGRVVDYVILMAYDEHYAGDDTSGSVSSLGFVQQGVKDMLAKVPAERTVVGLPFYTRLWLEKKEKGGVEVSSVPYGMTSAESVLKANGVQAKWDKKTGQYYAQYKGDGGTYKIWLEEETSIAEKLKVVKENNVAGAAFWKLGLERAATWLTVENALK